MNSDKLDDMMLDSKLPQELQDMVERELDPNEKVLWCGMRKPRLFSVNAIVFMVIGLFLLCFLPIS